MVITKQSACYRLEKRKTEKSLLTGRSEATVLWEDVPDVSAATTGWWALYSVGWGVVRGGEGWHV